MSTAFFDPADQALPRHRSHGVGEVAWMRFEEASDPILAVPSAA
ncbi:MAG TPA: hypothetical protein VFK10_14080 [Burkholderiaceae bacterium]|nr:hypothetical protein [Burkholderiaceae bacterium]